MLTSLGQGNEYYFQKSGWIMDVENHMFVV